jgi:hypothetical protein
VTPAVNLERLVGGCHTIRRGSHSLPINDTKLDSAAASRVIEAASKCVISSRLSSRQVSITNLSIIVDVTANVLCSGRDGVAGIVGVV